MSNSNLLLEAALSYASRGWRIHPLERQGKKPLLKDWPNRATSDKSVIRAWWIKYPTANIGLATGSGSGVFVLDVDISNGKLGQQSIYELEGEIGEIPDTLESMTGSGGRHLFFKTTARDVRNKQNIRPGLDVRGDGGYVVLPPSLHACGHRYDWPCGSKTLIAKCPIRLLNLLLPPTCKSIPPWERPAKPPPIHVSPHSSQVVERASRYLSECAPAVEGAGGHNALLWAARAMIDGFALPEVDALSLLWNEYNPRCIPPWDRNSLSDVKEFERKVSEVRRMPSKKPKGWLLDDYNMQYEDAALLAYGAKLRDGLLAGHEKKCANLIGLSAAVMPRNEAVCINGFPEQATSGCSENSCNLQTHAMVATADPLSNASDNDYEIPGLVADLMKHILDTAPSPNVPLAFCASVVLVAALAGRKYRDECDVRPNLYITALAPSGAGKEWGRKMIKLAIRVSGARVDVADSFASAQGIEDALFSTPNLLLLADEIDSLMKTLNVKGETRYEEIHKMVLSLFGESSSEHSMRRRAGVPGGRIVQPHLSVFGTAVPKNFYAALSERQMIGGLLSRMIVIDDRREWTPQKARPLDPLPESIKSALQYLGRIGGDDMLLAEPVLKTVESTKAAEDIFDRLQQKAKQVINGASDDEEVVKAVWARVGELARKLALIYAISEDCICPVVGEAAALWSTTFMQKHADKMLAMVKRYGANGEFEQRCRKFLDFISSKGGTVVHSVALKYMKIPSKDLIQLTGTLGERGEIKLKNVPTKGRTALYYCLS